jgi:hypothetical protein
VFNLHIDTFTSKRLHMKQKLFISVLFIFSFILQTYSQQKTISGKVTDSQGNGVPGVSVSARNGKQATQTSSTEHTQ